MQRAAQVRAAAGGGPEQPQRRLEQVDEQLRAREAALRRKGGGVGVGLARHGVGEEARGDHGGGHAPLVEARGHEQPGRGRRIGPDVGHAIQRHAVLRGPAVRDARLRPGAPHEGLYGVKAAAAFARAVVAAAHDEQIFIAAEVQPALFGARIGALQGGRVSERHDEGAHLVLLYKIQAAAVEYGKVGADDDAARADAAAVGVHDPRLDAQRAGALKDGQAGHQPREEAQRVELRHAGVVHCAAHGQGQLGLLRELRRKAQRLHRGGLPLQARRGGEGVQAGGRVGKAAGDARGQLAEALHSVQIGVEVRLGGLAAKAADEVGVERVVLGGEHGGGAARGARADALRLDEQAVHAAAAQLVQRQQTRHAAADDEHVAGGAAGQNGKAGKGRSVVPKAGHRRISFAMGCR